ncbi:putative P-loop containing nucleoside triphosphate hydrolase, DNA2/NAM7 helicase, helicase [Helianthus anomalus]
MFLIAVNFLPRSAEDLDPLQPLLKKCIVFLETEVVPTSSESSRPRMQLDRATVWLGIKALLGFLEPHAFEEGILERYPSFLSIVLNHISGDSLEFSYAINCLRLLFDMLGCKLWLSATLSPSVMRDTLLGQCFHTQDEKSHKEIFDLFPPFLQACFCAILVLSFLVYCAFLLSKTMPEDGINKLCILFPQSLEALQDGEHKKQRRHFLYFLLHQVTVSSNFSTLMRKKACQVSAFFVILTCIIDTLVIYDLCIALIAKFCLQIALLIIHRGYKMNPSCPPFECAHMWGPSLVASLKDSSLYSSLRQPAFDLIETILVSDASALVSSILHYQIHKGVDRNKVDFKDEDGNEGLFEDDVEEKDTSTSCWSEFSVQGQTAASEFGVWMCIPMLWVDVLVEIDPAVLPVSFSKAVSWALSRFSMVEPESNTETALPVGHWLTTRAPEVSRLLGWRTPSGFDDGGDGEESKNSVKVITMCIPLIRTFRRLTSHFIIRMEQGKQWTWEPRMAESLILLLVDPDDNARQVGRRILEQVANTRGLLSCLQFLCSCSASISSLYLGLKHARELLLLNPVLQTFQSVHHFFFVLCKLLKEGVPAGQRNDHSSLKLSSQGGFLQQPTFESIDGNSSNFDFTHWEKFSCLVSEVAWTSFCICLSEGKTFIDYKISQMTCIRLLECLPVVLQRLLKSMHKLPGDSDILVKNSVSYKWLHDLIYWGRSTLTVVHRYWKQAVLSLLDLLKESCVDKTSTIMAIEKLFNCENIPIDEFTEQVLGLFVSLVNDDTVPCRAYEKLSLKDPLSQAEGILREKCTPEKLRDLPLKESDFGAKMERENVIVLTDDENDVRDDINTLSDLQSAERASQMNEGSKSSSFDTIGLVDLESNVDKSCVIKGKLLQDTSKEKSSAAQRTKSFVENLSSKSLKNISSSQSIKKASAKSDRVIKELVFDAKDDPWEFALKSARHNQSHLGKPNTSGPKRKVIQLNLPVENRVSQSNRLRGGHQRFKPVRLDDWYRPILEMDYYATVGLASSSSSAVAIGNLKEVPVYFESPDDYVAVFRPLVLEELKAQLHNSFLEMSSTDEMSCGSLSVMSVERVDDFHLVRCVHDDRDLEGSKTCVENDLVLLTRQPFQTSSPEVHMVGKIERCEKDNKRRSSILMIKLYLQNGCSRLNRAKKLLMERSKWYIYRIMSITSQLREFQALSSLHSIPLLPVILNPNNQPKLIKSRMDLSKLSQLLQEILKSSFNDSQLQAINTVTDKRNDLHLSLIQGPPGTGKTRTIVAIVSALLSLTGMNARRTESCDMRPTMNKLSQSAAFARAWQDAALAKQLKDGEGKNYTATASHIRGRVVICAQSNAAVDELVSRISSHGLYGSDGSMYKPYLVRVGNAKTVHSSSLPFFIDTLVDERLTEEENRMDVKSDMDGGDSSSVVRSKLEKLVDRIRFLEAKRANLSNGNPDTKHCLEGDAGMGGDDVKEMSDAEIGARLRVLYSDKKAVYIELAAAQAREKKVNEKRKALKLKLRKSILKEAEIVITTLSGCGGDLYAVCSESMLTHKFSPSSESSLFDAVVIDEAAQALEPATLIPLQLLKSKGGKCIMVGDPKQLPATVLSDVASKYLYQCSMFERLQKAGHPVTMLTQQYRMHPEICRFPSLHFYDGNLLNGDGMSSKEKPFHKTKGLGPYLFFDIVDGVELHGKNSGSLYNECEADAAVELIRFFRKCYPSEFVGGKIGVITPYRSQLSLLRSRFSAAFGSCILDEMELNTVDGFQGREVDVLVVSTVRASSSGTSETNSNGGIGFVADVRRMNVALTRAKHSLWVLGNVRTLQRNKNWGALVKDAKDRNIVLSVEKPYASMFNYSLIIKSESRRVSDKKKGNVVNRDTEQPRSSKSKRGWYHSSNDDNGKEGKKAKMQQYHEDSSANKGNECVKKTDFRGKKEKQRVDVGSSIYSVVERSIDPNHKKRKQQREAVDALLPSGFISSSNKKQPESSSLKSVPNSSRTAIKQTTSRRKG